MELPSKIEVTPSERIRLVGILDADEFYRWLQRWLEFNGYMREDEDFEKYYDEVTLATGAKNISMLWIGKKPVDSYFTYVIEIDFKFIAITRVETQRENKTITLAKGDFDMRFKSYLNINVPKSGFLRGLYEGYLIRERIEEHKVDLYDKIMKLQGEVMAYIGQLAK